MQWISEALHQLHYVALYCTDFEESRRSRSHFWAQAKALRRMLAANRTVSARLTKTSNPVTPTRCLLFGMIVVVHIYTSA